MRLNLEKQFRGASREHNLHNANHGNQIQHTTNAMHTGERRASTIIICFVLFNFVYYVGNMLFCAMNIFSSR